MANKNMKSCSILFVIRELQVRAKMIYQYKPIRMAKLFFQNKQNKNLTTSTAGKDVEQKELSCLGECKWYSKFGQ